MRQQHAVAHGEVDVRAAAGRPSSAERFISREVRRGLQAVVGGVLAVAVVSYAAAASAGGETGKGAGGLASKLYAWTNSNDKSRGFRSSVISGLDADDPSFSPSRARVPPVDRVIAQV
jgi:hypothetical protein